MPEKQTLAMDTVEASITDTVGNKHFIPYSEVSQTQGLLVYFQLVWYA